VYALEARTGRLLWSFQVAPQQRRIPVFGKLISRWPVAGGVIVDQDTVYAAAGITHYDGTYVVALDAVSGRLKACNTQSGKLSREVNGGVSLQGELTIADGQLRFLGGGVYHTARYDLKTLECLNEPKPQVYSQFQTAFYPYYPTYGKYLSLRHDCGNGTVLSHEASYEGSMFDNLALKTTSPGGGAQQNAQRDSQRRRGQRSPQAKTLWQDREDRRFTSFIVADDHLLAAGHPDNDPSAAFLAAIRIREGSDAWRHPLPANAVKGGAAIDPTGRILVALENGQLLCFAPDPS
jgi:outer membrane protein assembly factor BamB